MTYEITVDLDACEGIFACLVRDDRFSEAADGLVTLPGSERDGDELTATFEAKRADAEDAAAACPTDAIAVREAVTADPDAPDDLLDAHPETAYFWGRVVGDGEVTTDGVTVRTADETAAERLAAIAGADGIDHETIEREYAHDASITRREDSYTVRLHGAVGDRAAAAFGLPLSGGSGGYRLDALSECDRQLLRGLLEGCGTVCFKSSSGTVGISFVHDDRKLLDRVGALLDDADVPSPYGGISETSSGGYWFGIDDDAAPAFGEWLYENSETTGLFAPTRRRKLRRSIEEATAY